MPEMACWTDGARQQSSFGEIAVGQRSDVVDIWVELRAFDGALLGWQDQKAPGPQPLKCAQGSVPAAVGV